MGDHAPAVLPTGRTVDAWGAALAGALAVWVVFGAAPGGRPFPVLALIGASALVCAMGRWLADRDALSVHRLIAIAIAGAVALTAPGVLHAGGPPLGYANANATLASIGALAGVGVATAERDRQRRTAWIALSSSLVLTVLLTRSAAGVICLVVAAALLASSAVTRRHSLALLGGVIAVVLSFGITVAIAVGANPAGLGERAAERRELWTAADAMVSARPIRGVGVGRFEVLNPVSADVDLRWAHHGYLQVAAETGIVGLALLLTLLGWVYGRLALAALVAPHRASLAAAAVTVVALHATVDHVLHEPAVILTLAALVGASTGSPARRLRQITIPTPRHHQQSTSASVAHPL